MQSSQEQQFQTPSNLGPEIVVSRPLKPKLPLGTKISSLPQSQPKSDESFVEEEKARREELRKKEEAARDNNDMHINQHATHLNQGSSFMLIPKISDKKNGTSFG